MVGRFFNGFRAPIKGLKLIRSDKKLKALSIVPIALTLVLIITGLYLVGTYSRELIQYFFNSFDSFSRIVQLLIIMSTFVFLSILVLVLSYFLASILSIPANAVIASHCLIKQNTLTAKNQTLSETAKTFFNMLRVSLVKGLLFLILSLIIFIGSLIPIISVPMIFLGLMLLAYDCIDFSLEALEFNLNQRINFFKTHLPEISGFAVFLGIVFFIPLINVILLPIAVAGGSCIVSYDKKSNT